MQFADTPMMALTATCPSFLKSSVLKILHLAESSTLVFSGQLNRPNLHYSVIEKPTTSSELTSHIKTWILDNYPAECGIVYCLSKKDTEALSRDLRSESDNKIQCSVYHADLSDQEKELVHLHWRRGTIKVVIATTAFGSDDSLNILILGY
jgi:ATP-dependent DNA helicase Q1